MPITIIFDHPVTFDGQTFSEVCVRRPGPIAFAGYWRNRESRPQAIPPRFLSIPPEVADALEPADHRRMVEAMTTLTWPYVFAIALWRFVTGQGTAQENRKI